MKNQKLLIKSVHRTLKSHKIITIALILLLSFTVAVSWISKTASNNLTDELTEGIGAKEIEVVQGLNGQGGPPLDNLAVSNLASLDKVDHVFPSGSSGVDLPDEVSASNPDAGAWWLMPQNPYDDRLTDSDGKAPKSLDFGEMLVPSEYSYLLDKTIEVGVTKAVSSNSGVAEMRSFTVVGVYDPESVQGEVPGAVFINLDEFIEVQKEALPPNMPPYSSIYVYVDNVDSVAEVQREIESMQYGTRSVIGAGIQLDAAKRGISTVSILLLFITIVSALLAGSFVASGWLTTRVEEVGLFRALGWSRREVVSLYLKESFIFSILVSILGTFLGIFFALMLISAQVLPPTLIGVELDLRNLPPSIWSIIFPMLAVPFGFVFGTIRKSRLLLRADADSLLRQI